MNVFSRRQVLSSLSAGVLGVLACGKGKPGAPGLRHLPAPDLPALAGRQDKTRIYYLFSAKPKGLEGWPFHEYDHAERAKIFEKRIQQIKDIEWVGGDIIEKDEDILAIKDHLRDVDGLVVIVLTSPSSGLRKLSEMGITTPTLVFNDLFCGDCGFLGYQQQASSKGMRLVSLSSADIGLLERKIQLLRTAGRLRRSKIICFRDEWNVDKDLKQAALEKLGVEIVQMGSRKIVQAYEASDITEARQIAESWVSTAEKVVEPTIEEIVDSARMYIGLKQIMEQEKANAITIDCLGMVYGDKIPAYPCLAFVQMNNDGYVGACESDMQATLTMLIVGFLADRPGFISDPVLDTEAGLIYHAHCLSATRMAGFDKPAEACIIRSHSEDRSGVSLEVEFSPGNIITACKYVSPDRMLVSTGKIVGNKNTPLACRSKMITRVKGVRKMLNGYSGGLHRIIFYGDHVRDLEDLGKLVDFQVIVETA